MNIKCLKSLSNTDLMRSADQAVRAERNCKINVILHLVEISRRKLHLDWGYTSLWKYCEVRFAFSPAVIGHRLQVAAKCSEFPKVLNAIVEGEMSLTTAGMVASILTKDNCGEVLSLCANKSKSQVEEILVGYRPRQEVQPTIRRVTGPINNDGLAEKRGNHAQNKNEQIDSNLSSRKTLKMEPQPLKNCKCRIQAATPETFNFGFTGSKSLKEKIERLAALKGLHSRNALAALIEAGIDAELNRIDPVRTEQRAEKRRAIKNDHRSKKFQIPEKGRNDLTKKGRLSLAIAGNELLKTKRRSPAIVGSGICYKKILSPVNVENDLCMKMFHSPVSDGMQSGSLQKRTKVRAKRIYIPKALSRQIKLAAEGRCQHVGPEGNRCTETVGVQVDHRLEVAAGGTNEPGNLQILCRAHNFRKAELRFGEIFMAGKVAGPRKSG